jgi:hypothetical protein
MPALSKRTPEIEGEIIRRLSLGEPLAQICRDDGMPHPTNWRDWCANDEALAIAYARAREDGFDQIAAQALIIADTQCQGEIVTEKADGTVERKREDMLGHRRLQIETRLKLLAKWDPKRYGDKVQVESQNRTLAMGIPADATPEQAAEWYSKLMKGE